MIRSIILVLFLIILASCCWKVPEGYEDEKGFHYGKEPVKKDDEKA